MTRRHLSALALLFALTLSAYAEEPPALQLVWSDEFDVDGPLDPNDWRHERGFRRNRELQWYQQENARCEGGFLVIEARRERLPVPTGPSERSVPDWAKGWTHAEYTSASVNTRGKHAWQYGRFEVRAKIEARPGLWPAIWTLGVGPHWPACGEIDVMECYGGDLLANAAWGPSPHKIVWDAVRRPLREFGEDWDRDFHVWRLDWDAQRVRLSVDGHLMNEIETSRADTPDGKNPFRQPHYVLLNLAVGGEHGGDPSGTPFPSRYLIDYVRVYQ